MNKEKCIIKKILNFYAPCLIYVFKELNGKLLIEYDNIFEIDYVNYHKVDKLIRSYGITYKFRPNIFL